MSQSNEIRQAIESNSENKFVFVIHENSDVEQYHKVLFKRMFKRLELSDVTLRCEDRDIPAHRIVLAAHSKFFAKQFDEKPANGLTIVIDNVKYELLISAIQLMYCGSVSIEKKWQSAWCKLLTNFEIDGVENELRDSVHESVDKNAKSKYTEKTRETKGEDAKEKLNGNGLRVQETANRTIRGEDKKCRAETQAGEKRNRIEIHDIQEMSKYDAFVSTIDEIIGSVTEDNIDVKAPELLSQNIYTKERLLTVVNLMMRQVTSVALRTPTISYAKLAAIIKSHDRNDHEFDSILFNVCHHFFLVNIGHKAMPPNCGDMSTFNAFDQQTYALQLIEYHYARERLRRIVRFLSELYTHNVIHGGILLDIEEKQIANLERGKHEYFFVLLSIFEVAGEMLSSEHPDYTNECVMRLKAYMAASENNQILDDVRRMITHAIELGESGWQLKSNDEFKFDEMPSNETTLVGNEIEQHLYWIKNSVVREPAKMSYHVTRRNADEEKMSRRHNKKQNKNDKPNIRSDRQSGANGSKAVPVVATALAIKPNKLLPHSSTPNEEVSNDNSVKSRHKKSTRRSRQHKAMRAIANNDKDNLPKGTNQKVENVTAS